MKTEASKKKKKKTFNLVNIHERQTCHSLTFDEILRTRRHISNNSLAFHE